MDTKKIIAGGATILAVGGAGFYLTNAQHEKTEMAEEGSTGTSQTTPTPAPSTQTGGYKDGTYSANGTYNSPGGEQGVHISIVLQDGKIADATFTGSPKSPADKFNQGKFAEGFKQEVVGKSIDEVKLDVVNGSSLTPKGFMDALDQIKKEAHS